MAYYWVRFQYKGEVEKERFIEGMANLKEFIQMVKGRGAEIKSIRNHDFKDVTSRYDK